jgi:hypothetical protein
MLLEARPLTNLAATHKLNALLSPGARPWKLGIGALDDAIDDLHSRTHG